MQWNADTNTLELTARNVAALTAKLDDPRSACTLTAGDSAVTVQAIERPVEAGENNLSTERIVSLTRTQLEVLAIPSAVITVGDVTVVAVPDAAHYSGRPSGAVYMPTSGEFHHPDASHCKLRHICEVCGRVEILTPDDAFNTGWDYPPRMGSFGVIGPRKCGDCAINNTVWWALTADHYSFDMLSDHQRDTLARIVAEPQSITVSEQ